MRALAGVFGHKKKPSLESPKKKQKRASGHDRRRGCQHGRGMAKSLMPDL